jgi:outer membrane protein insertion porin family
MALLLAAGGLSKAVAQNSGIKVINPDISYAGTPMSCVIGGITVDGVKGMDDYMLIGVSGLSVGQQVTVPGDDITQAIKRYWKNGMFSDVKIVADSLVGNKIYLRILLAQRPSISQINYNGVRKSERTDLETKLGLQKGNQISPSVLDRAHILAKRYFDGKGFKNAVVDLVQRDDVTNPGKVILDVNVDKKEKVKVHEIKIEGNHVLTTSQIKGGFFTKGVMKKTHETGKFANWFKSKKFIDDKYATDKQNIIDKYNELGYRDAVILADSVSPYDDKTVNVYIKVEEGQKYYLRNLDWVGNTIFSTDQLNYALRMKHGDVYNQKLLNDRLNSQDDPTAVGNLYYNRGYVFYNLDPTEVNIVGDSIDLEMRIVEGPQATISHVRISGNTRVYEEVIRRELRNKPGDLFNKEALMRSYREIATMGNFDPEHISPDVQPNRETSTVDINWGLSQKSNDQVEFSLGWGQTGVIGRIGLKFGNFSMRNLFNRKGVHRFALPEGDGETFSLNGETNGRYYQSYSLSYLNPWFGGKRPNSLSFSLYFSKQTDVSDNYYNNSSYYNYYNYLYGYGSNTSNYYMNYSDPDKYVKLIGLSLGWGKRLRWPDDYFTFSASLNYTRYMLKNWRYFIMTTGNCNNINANFTLARNSVDNPIYPRSGTDFQASVTLTPPFSMWDGKDYANLANNPKSSTYEREQREKFKWVEYHKWKFRLRTYTALSGVSKCPVLMTRVEFGILGAYNKNKKSPFETFYVGGDGMSGYSTSYATETIGLRGYENGCLTPYGADGYAYSRMTLELHYPLMLSNSTNIYALIFAEGGNAWSQVKNFNPFDMKRSAGVGVRIQLPMVGLMGIDWGYGFDKVFGDRKSSGSQFHFILGQEF